MKFRRRVVVRRIWSKHASSSLTSRIHEPLAMTISSALKHRPSSRPTVLDAPLTLRRRAVCVCVCVLGSAKW